MQDIQIRVAKTLRSQLKRQGEWQIGSYMLVNKLWLEIFSYNNFYQLILSQRQHLREEVVFNLYAHWDSVSIELYTEDHWPYLRGYLYGIEIVCTDDIRVITDLSIENIQQLMPDLRRLCKLVSRSHNVYAAITGTDTELLTILRELIADLHLNLHKQAGFVAWGGMVCLSDTAICCQEEALIEVAQELLNNRQEHQDIL